MVSIEKWNRLYTSVYTSYKIMVFDIRGKVKPFTNEPLFLCADFDEPSMVGSNNKCLFYVTKTC